MRKNKRRRRRTARLFLLLLIAAALVADSNLRIVTTEYTVYSEVLPSAFSGLRVAVISDLHGTAFCKDDRYLLSCLRKTDPDIIAVTGDFADDSSQLDWARKLIPRLTAVAPVFYVTGNHEWPAGIARELISLFEENGATVLRNDWATVSKGEDSIIIAGIEDPNGPADMKKPSEVVSSLRSIEGDKYLLVLVHRNDWLEKYSELDVDTVLCGHGHGGIVRLPFTDGLVDTNLNLFPTFTSGIYSKNGTDLAVSRGLGNSVRTIRFLNNPHLPVVILKSK